ncbi:MAG: hypothetical protein PWP70_1162 [Moorella sp. (in: firmicutes)]|nr:hypothetical protein [Moorella sp. (in: firmicutes)]
MRYEFVNFEDGDYAEKVVHEVMARLIKKLLTAIAVEHYQLEEQKNAV